MKKNQIALFKKYYTTRCIKLRNKLVELNINLARKEVYKLPFKMLGRYTQLGMLEDLLQEACFGLIKAIEKFDPYKQNSFSTYAIPYIKGKLLQYNRDKFELIKMTQETQTIINNLNKRKPIKSSAKRIEKALIEYRECSNVLTIASSGILEKKLAPSC